MATTEAACLDALREAAEKLGESPTKAQYEELGLRPASATIIRQIGGWNKAKQKAGLETYLSRGSRVATKPNDITLPEELDWEELSVDQRWHYRNREWNKERTLRRRGKLRHWLNQKKQATGCKRCGVRDPACLDYHHIDTDEKEMSVGKMITHGYGKDPLRPEIESCEILCANCHRKEHFSQPEGSLRKWVYEQKEASGGCSKCSQTDVVCLDFHHDTDKKVDTIARMVTDGRPKDAIRAEIQRCIVLCANCHRKSHFVSPVRSDGKHDNNK